MPVKKYYQRNRPKPYGVKWGHWKKPSYKFFETESDRDAFFDELVRKEKREGLAALEISTMEAQIMRTCIDLLGSPQRVLTVCQAEAEKQATLDISLEQAVKEYLDEKLNLGRDDNYLRAVRNILERFQTSCPVSSLSDLQLDQVKAWIFSLGYSPVTVRNYIKNSSAFMEWCVRHGYVRENVFRNIPVPQVIMPEPEFLTIDQTKAVFAAAKEHYPDALAYLALSAFAGIRSSACARLELKHIDFKQRGILIRAEAAKNKRRIFVDGHPDNLWQWLEYAKKNAPEGFSLSKRLWDRRKQQIAIKTKFTMPHNALRHSFCTYHVALHGDAGKTATLLTHRGNVAILYEHYKGNVARAEAGEYFAVLP